MTAKKPKKPKGKPRDQRGGGRKPHIPTAQTRETVKAMTGYGVPQEDICLAVGVATTVTLRKRYPAEIRLGLVTANSRVAESAFNQATGRAAVYDEAGRILREEQKPVVAMTIFWLKVRMGWKEPAQQHEHGGTPGAEPIPVRIDSLTDAQLLQFAGRVDRRIAALEARTRPAIESRGKG
jgi:hypothetical protein